ncbi:hypothetical protein [Actinopolymorpha pittospori]|uniref:Uncharacterized protein n=1 Tax=Actinopolymorpha pittospori TaxID=648752 RepID=A0A927MSE2_9ACTN|nr:hypothetical protein [Actinopolymorpha pittospori]MBE1604003.1 hypothetical protein [Actinopolymorpha pittospori]
MAPGTPTATSTEEVVGADWHLYCDEEAKLKRLPPKVRATVLARELGWPRGEELCDPAIFLGNGPEGAEADVPGFVLELSAKDGATEGGDMSKESGGRHRAPTSHRVRAEKRRLIRESAGQPFWLSRVLAGPWWLIRVLGVIILLAGGSLTGADWG